MNTDEKMSNISKNSVEQTRIKTSRRICFATTHKQALKRSSKPLYVGTLNLPLCEGFSRIFPYELFPVKKTKESVWRSIKSEAEYEEIETWINKQGQRVFIRDCLYTSIAMSFNFIVPEGERTEIGELEYRAKNEQDRDAIEKIIQYCSDTINELSIYRNADFICAVPPQPNKKFDLPSLIVSGICQKIGKTDITNDFQFNGIKKPIKTANLNEKWLSWDNAKVSFNSNIENKTVILIDDKYQSGTTMQYIAMKLQEMGAYQVYGLSIVKTMKDTDNQ